MAGESYHPHILSSFEDALKGLRSEVQMMAALTEKNVQRALDAMFQQDEALAKICIADDEEVDSLECDVDRRGVDILIRFGPVAADLRSVIAAMKVSNNLERASDGAVGIARKTRKLIQQGYTGDEIEILRPVALEALALFRDSIQSFNERNTELALQLKPRDRKLDEAVKEICDQFTGRMAADPKRVPSLLELIFIARHLERLGDHGTNIAEDVVYACSAEDIRHQGKAE